MDGDFNNLDELFDHSKDNPGFDNNTRESIDWYKENKKIQDFIEKNTSLFNSTTYYRYDVVDKLFVAALKKFGDSVRDISLDGIAKAALGRAVGDSDAVQEIFEKLSAACCWSMTPGASNARLEDIIGDFDGLVRAWKTHEYQYIQAGLAEIELKLKKKNAPDTAPTPTPDTTPIPAPTPTPDTTPIPAPTPTPDTTLSPSPSAIDESSEMNDRPLGKARTGWFLDKLSERNWFSFQKKSILQATPIDDESRIWKKYGEDILVNAKTALDEGAENLPEILVNVLNELGVKTGKGRFEKILIKVAREFGLDNDDLESDYEELAKDVFSKQSKRKKKAFEEYKEELLALDWEGTGLTPYDDQTAQKYAFSTRRNSSLRSLETYLSLLKNPDYKNASLGAIGKIARTLNKTFHHAYARALEITNPQLQLDKELPGQDVIDFQAIMAATVSSDRIDFDVRTADAEARRKFDSKKLEKASADNQKNPVVKILEAFGRRGFVGAINEATKLFGARNAKNNLNEPEEEFVSVAPEDVKSYFREINKILEEARLPNGGFDVNSIPEEYLPDLHRFVYGSSNYSKTAYKIVQERKRSQTSSVEPGSTQGLPRRTKKPWQRPEIAFGKIKDSFSFAFDKVKDGFSFAFGATKTGAHRALDPALKAAGSAWQAVKDGFNGILGVDDEGFQAALEEQRSRVSEYWANRWASDKYYKQRVQDAEEEFNELDAQRDELSDSAKIFGEPEKERWKQAKREYRKRQREWDKYKKRSSKEDARQLKSEKAFTDWEAKFRERWKGGDAPQAPEPTPATSPGSSFESGAPSAPKAKIGKAPTAPGGPKGAPVSPGGMGGGLAKAAGAIAVIVAIYKAIVYIARKINEWSSFARKTNDEYAPYNAKIAELKVRQDAADFHRKVRYADFVTIPYASGLSPQEMLSETSNRYEDAKSRLSASWTRVSAPLKSGAMHGAAGLMNMVSSTIAPTSVGDAVVNGWGTPMPLVSGILGALDKDRTADDYRAELVKKLDEILSPINKIAQKFGLLVDDKSDKNGGPSIKDSALFQAIEHLGNFNKSRTFHQTFRQSDWTTEVKNYKHIGRDADAPARVVIYDRTKGSKNKG